jgi:hypothetical protein
MTRPKIGFTCLFSTLGVFLLIEILLGGQAFAQFKEYKDQYGRFSIQVPQDYINYNQLNTIAQSNLARATEY